MNRIKNLRKAKKVTLVEMGKAMDIPRSTLSRYENEQSEPKQETWEKLANYFGVSVPYIMGLNTAQNVNEVSISKQEYDRLKEIERKYYKIIDVIDTF